MSRITTHVLDTSAGIPGRNIKIELYHFKNDEWILVSDGVTDENGRIMDLTDDNAVLESGIYKLKFHTGDYYSSRGIESFYPYSEIIFNINEHEHYHVPLLMNPFGYTTYRGS